LSTFAISGGGAVRDLYDRFYLTLTDSIPCFRLTNADSQIGCSGSDTNTRGVVHYVQSQSDVEWLLHHSPHPPYIALMEPAPFTSVNVPRLRDSSRVNGILLRYDSRNTHPDDVEFFSAERKCPNKDFGVDSCNDSSPWNPYTNGTSLSFSDFGDFPIFAVTNDTFMEVLECFQSHNAGGDGGIIDYPLCAAEMVADMLTAKNTETCFRRAKLLTLQVNGVELCDPLGDKNVWGSIFELNEERLGQKAILLATKLDSIAFFPYLSWGANNELAGVATLMAVLETIGNLRREGTLLSLEHPILYSFFHGESWDYIGSSRMVYDMERNNFPENFGPKFSHDSIMDYLELTNVGLFDNERPVTYYHNKTSSVLLSRLVAISSETHTGMTLAPSDRVDLPVASLQRFLRRNSAFSGAILSDFNEEFRSKFYGSRYDNEGIFNQNGSNLSTVSRQLANLATSITWALLDVAGANFSDGNNDTYEADANTINDILECFLVNTDCDTFKRVLTQSQANELENRPLHRYVTVDTTTNSETIITYALAADFTGVYINGSGDVVNDSIPCGQCSSIASQLSEDNSQVTVLQQYVNGSDNMCFCVKSFVHYHTAVSPAFVEKDYSSHEYSTWVESRWRFINLRIYLVTYPLQEVAFFFCGLAMIFIALFLAVQATRKSDKIFNTYAVVHSPMRLTAADRAASIDLSDFEDSDVSPPDTRERFDSGGASNIQ
jgi:nicastrin